MPVNYHNASNGELSAMSRPLISGSALSSRVTYTFLRKKGPAQLIYLARLQYSVLQYDSQELSALLINIILSSPLITVP